MDEIRFSQRAKVITLWILLVVAIWFLYRVRDVAVPFFWAIITAYIFHPLIKALSERTRVPRVWWVILAYVSAFALVGWAVAVLVPLFAQQYEGLVGAAPGILEDIQIFLRENNRVVIYGFTINLESLLGNAVTTLSDLVRNLPGQALAGVTMVFGTVLKVVIYLVATFYFLLLGEKWAQWILSLLPPPVQAELAPLLQRTHVTMTAYLRGQLIRMLIMGTLIYAGLASLQVRFALVMALIGGVLEIVPILGPIVSGGIAALVALFQPIAPYGWNNLTLAIAVVILFVLLNQLEENFLIPNLMGYMVDLPPLLVIFVVLAGETLAGFLGLLVAVPVAATLKIFLRYIYAKLMDKPVIFDELPIRRRPLRPNKKEKEVAS